MKKENVANHEKLRQERLREEVIESVSKTEEFFKAHKKELTLVVVSLLVLVGAVFSYHEFYLKALKEEALEQMISAESLFRKGEYETALNGDGNILGFEQVIEQYGSKGGKIVYFYAGLCNFHLGKYQESIDLLKSYSGGDDILNARAKACIGDAYVALKEYKAALSYFLKAAKVDESIYSANYIFKAAMVYEELGNKDEALACYLKIKDKYPQSPEGESIDQHIARIKY